MIKGVVFDMDGLMIDTEKILMKFWCEAAAESGYNMKPEHVLKIRSLAAKYASVKLKEMLGNDFDYSKVRKRRKELVEDYIAHNGIEKKRGLDKLLEYLRSKNIKMAVATSTDFERTKVYLSQIGCYEYFDAIVCGPMVPNGKPEPDIYLKACEMLGFKPQECVALEDSPNGILSAYRAGCKPIMVPDLDEPNEETCKLLFAKVSDLEKVISIIR